MAPSSSSARLKLIGKYFLISFSLSQSLKHNNPPIAELTFSLSFDRLDGKHVVFGQVKEGMDVVTKMETFGLHDGGVIKKIVVTDCGEIK